MTHLRRHAHGGTLETRAATTTTTNHKNRAEIELELELELEPDKLFDYEAHTHWYNTCLQRLRLVRFPHLRHVVRERVVWVGGREQRLRSHNNEGREGKATKIMQVILQHHIS